jgi:hypothetical protein
MGTHTGAAQPSAPTGWLPTGPGSAGDGRGSHRDAGLGHRGGTDPDRCQA